jgi:hypothetical protein
MSDALEQILVPGYLLIFLNGDCIQNAVYGQLYTALLVYVLLKFLFDQGNATVHVSARLTFVEFDRQFTLKILSPEWKVYLSSYIIFPSSI